MRFSQEYITEGARSCRREVLISEIFGNASFVSPIRNCSDNYFCVISEYFSL